MKREEAKQKGRNEMKEKGITLIKNFFLDRKALI